MALGVDANSDNIRKTIKSLYKFPLFIKYYKELRVTKL